MKTEKLSQGKKDPDNKWKHYSGNNYSASELKGRLR